MNGTHWAAALVFLAGASLQVGLAAEANAISRGGATAAVEAGGPAPPRAIRILVIGDSTVQSYPNPPADRPTLTGWGQVLGEFLTDRATVVNRAVSGSSSKSFLTTGLWEKALAEKADYLFLQFGHNDCPGKGDRSTDPKTDYRDYLRRYLADARKAGMRPVLVTPVARRTFDQQGRIVTTLGPYAEAMLQVGKEAGIPVIDLHARSIALFNRLGDVGSADFSPRADDRSHFSGKGARAIARLIVEAIPDAVPDLRPYLARSQKSRTSPAPSPQPASLDEAAGWLAAKAKEMIRASRRTMKSGIAAFPPQAGGGYEAFWLRDYAYMLEGCPEAFSDRELRDACLLFVSATRADGAGVDCVKFDGTPIYMPGYGTMGENPVADGGPFTVAVAWHTHQRLHDKPLILQIADRLVKTMKAVPRNPKTGMVHIKPEGYDRCPYGFTDTVRKQGDELFTSLLWLQAARRLADLLDVAGRREEADTWRAEAERVAGGVGEVFWHEKIGLFRAATLKCREPDVWGSALAVHLGVATRTQSLRVASYFRDHYAEIIERGQLRHLPGGMYWEAACDRDTYQNGGYWATPVGWFIETLDLVDANLADQTLLDLVADFQKRGVTEWVRGDRQAVRNYIASATMPLAGARALLKRREAAPAPSRAAPAH